MRDQRLPDAATDGATTVDTTPEHDDGKPKPDAGQERQGHRDGTPTQEAQKQPGGRPDPTATDPGDR